MVCFGLFLVFSICLFVFHFISTILFRNSRRVIECMRIGMRYALCVSSEYKPIFHYLRAVHIPVRMHSIKHELQLMFLLFWNHTSAKIQQRSSLQPIICCFLCKVLNLLCCFCASFASLCAFFFFPSFTFHISSWSSFFFILATVATLCSSTLGIVLSHPFKCYPTLYSIYAMNSSGDLSSIDYRK